MEKVTVRTDRDDPSPAELRGYFAEILADLDACPRPLMVSLDVRNDRNSRVSIDMEEGEPVFRIEGRSAARANYRGRYMAEHPVPLELPLFRRFKMVFEPASANRVRVRLPTLFERLFK